ncbi:MAG: cytochrome c [Shewanella sp.]|nr:cytochrome c [Shewanella sp.]MCF1431741.1 cytochrome c [Shewanella sp.]MCF1438457.1 cytochrome c [Shewanella sp.]MCF1456172.1 cytochrome c [Shewanella sp.]
MKKVLLTALVAASFSSAVMANNFRNTEDAIEYRQDVFNVIAHNFGDMGAMMKGKKPFDVAAFEMRAQNVAALSKLPLEGFVPGSNKGNTDAKSDIWSNKGEFDTKMKQFQLDAANLAKVAATGNKAAIKKAFGATAKNCKACHDTFKKD